MITILEFQDEDFCIVKTIYLFFTGCFVQYCVLFYKWS